MSRGRRKRYRVKEHQLYTVRPEVWNKLKRENTIDRVYRFRARKIEVASTIFSPAAALQSALFEDKIQKVSFEGHPPVFILGLWRSGTTHLHYLMARDPQFGYLKNHQAFTFNMSLLSFDKLNRVLDPLLPGSRPQDNVGLTLDDPAEEEQPLSTMTTRSSIHSFFFPRNQDYFTRYHLFEGIGVQERENWKRDYLYLLKNIALYNRKNDLILKNPHNTGRVKELLELFPDARFVFLHRDPYTVFRSTKKLYMRMINSQFLQFFSQREIERMIVENNARILGKYLEERDLIPGSNLVELGFHELENAPVDAVRTIYERLSLQGFDAARPEMEAYLESVKHYKKNRHRPVSGRMRRILRKEWDQWFEAFGYDSRARQTA